MVSRSVLASAPSSCAASTLMPLTSTACATSSSPCDDASLPLSAPTSFSSARTWSSTCAMRGLQLGRRRLQRARPRCCTVDFELLQVGQRVRAGHRLDAAHAGGHAAFADDLEQADVAGALHVRAAAQLAAGADVEHAHVSPYFSPNSIIAPVFLAASMSITRACVGCVGEDLGVDALLRSRGSASSVTGALCAKSKRVLSASTSEPFCCTCVAQHFAQRLVHQVRDAVVAHGGARGARVDLRRRPCRRPSACPASACRGGRTRRP